MKKIISLALAASMVAGMSVASFARTTDKYEEPFVDSSSELYTYKDGKNESIFEEASLENGEINVKNGKPVAIKVETNDLSNSEMKRYKAYFEASVGADMVKSVELKYHKYATENGKTSAVATTFKFDPKMEVAPGTGIYDLGRSAYEKKILNSWKAVNSAVDKNAWNVRVYAHMNEEERTTDLELDSTTLANGKYAIVLVDKNDPMRYIAFDADDTVNYSQAEFTLADRAYAKNNANQLYKNAKKVTEGKDEQPKYDHEYAWFVVINFNNEAANIDEDVMGKVTVAKSSAVAKDNFEDEDYYKTVNFLNINKETKPHPHDEHPTNQELEDFEFELDGQQAMLVVDTTGVKDAFYTCFTTKMNETVWEKYSEPDYELYFYGFDNAVKFNRTGDLFFYAEDAEFTADWHVYEIVDAKTGELKEVPAVYDEEENTLKIRTRVLKNYVVSEEDLLATEDAPVEEDKTDAPVEEVKPEKDVPNTGR